MCKHVAVCSKHPEAPLEIRSRSQSSISAKNRPTNSQHQTREDKLPNLSPTLPRLLSQNLHNREPSPLTQHSSPTRATISNVLGVDRRHEEGHDKALRLRLGPWSHYTRCGLEADASALRDWLGDLEGTSFEMSWNVSG